MHTCPGYYYSMKPPGQRGSRARDRTGAIATTVPTCPQSVQDASEILQQGSRTRTASKRAVDVDHRSRRRMQSLFDADAPSPGTFHSFDYADTPSPSPLVGGGEPLPAFTRAVPSNVILPPRSLTLLHGDCAALTQRPW